MALALGAPLTLSAHPLLQSKLNGTWSQSGLNLRATVSLEEALAGVGGRPEQIRDAAQLRAAFAAYSESLSAGFTLEIGDQHLPLEVELMETPTLEDLKRQGLGAPALYGVSAIIPAGVHGRLRLSQDLLKGKVDPLGAPWSSNYHVLIADRTAKRDYRGVLSREQAFIADPEAPTTRAGLAWAYLREGFHHILAGYDHLLFVSALTLAALSALNLMAVVGMFTLAHTLTLVLAVLGYAHLSSRIVEPGIALSIVVVALLNLWAARGKKAAPKLGWKRMAVAFGFGLFHGLGFAGGLLEAMQGLQGASQGLALLSFSGGVELGHLCVVIPLYLGLKFIRERGGSAMGPRVLRWGSLVVAAAGSYYLFAALQEALA